MDIAVENAGFVTASDVAARGIRNRELAAAVSRGELVKIDRGLYCTPETWEDEYVTAQHRFARGFFSHDTALYLLGLSDSAPESLTMSFPRGYNPSSAKKMGIITKSSPDELHGFGCLDIATPYGNVVRAYDADHMLAGDRGLALRGDLGWIIHGQELYLGLDHARVAGPSTRYLAQNSLTGAALGIRGYWHGLSYDLFWGKPIRPPAHFNTPRHIFGFTLGFEFKG